MCSGRQTRDYFVYCLGILCRFLLPILLHESLPCCLPSRCVLPFPRTSLHDLLPFVPPEVVPVLPQFPSQAFYRYDQYCFHIISFSIVFPFFVSFSLFLVPAFMSRSLTVPVSSLFSFFVECSSSDGRVFFLCFVRAISVSASFSMLIVSDVIRAIPIRISFASRSHRVRPRIVPIKTPDFLFLKSGAKIIAKPTLVFHRE